MEIITIILIHLLIYSIPPIIGAFLDKNAQILLNYTYLGTLFTILQIFDTLYLIQYKGSIMNGGDIVYSALLFTTLYLIAVQPDAKVTRELIYFFFVDSFFLFTIFGFLLKIRSSPFIVNFHITNELLEFSLISLMSTLLLLSFEIFMMLILIRKLACKLKSQELVTVAIGIIYYITILLDGVLYPFIINMVLGYELKISNGILAKMIFGAGFGIILIALLNFRPRNLSMMIASKTPLIYYILPAKLRSVKSQLNEAQKEIEELHQIIPICAWCKKIRDDNGYWEQVEQYLNKHNDIRFTHGICPECSKKFMKKRD